MKLSFNPCFTGLWIFTAEEELNKLNEELRFQSLFYWIMDFYGDIITIYNKDIIEFQSLFYWIMDFYNGYKGTFEPEAEMFQSLFYWIMDFYKLKPALMEIDGNVSILVLLDYGFLL